MANILVTGGAGFIGSHLCEALLEQGHSVTCLDNFSTGKKQNIDHLHSLHVLEGDVNERATWKTLKGERFDAVYHYAATVGVLRTEEGPEKVLADVYGVDNMVQFAKQGGAKKVIFASSSEVYGDPQLLPEVEEDGFSGWSPYSTVKLYGEHALKALWAKSKIPTLSLRFFNVYGPRQSGTDYGFVVSRFMQQVMANQSPTVFGDGSQTRDFVYVKDNVRVALAALDNVVSGEAINVGSGRETSVLDLAKAVIYAAGAKGRLKPSFLPARGVEISRRCASVDKMRKLFGVSCDVSLQDGIAMTMAIMRNELSFYHKAEAVQKVGESVLTVATASD